MTLEQATIYLIFPAAGYLLGSIPFAWVIGKFNGVDIRTVGSKNIGSTNLGRTLGPRFFWYAFVLDAAKGFLPVLAAALLTQYFNGDGSVGMVKEVTPNDMFVVYRLGASTNISAIHLPMWAPLLTAVGCMLGHVFPVWLKFKGGKGVATGFGVVLGFWPLYTVAGLIAGAFFVFMLLVYRYISLASMTAATLFFCIVASLASSTNRYTIGYFYVQGSDRTILITLAGLFAAMIVFRHWANIGRLLKGTEPQIGHREIDKAKMRPHDGDDPPTQ